jgi:hypothetical protein
MWQRKQTIFLGITVLCLILMNFFPIWIASDAETEKILTSFSYTELSKSNNGEVVSATFYPYLISAILAIAAATIAVIEIGKFTNRMLQLKLAALNSLFMAGSIGSAVYFATTLIKSNQLAGTYGAGLYLPAAAMVSNMIANRFIRRDEKLVRDSDRIR